MIRLISSKTNIRMVVSSLFSLIAQYIVESCVRKELIFPTIIFVLTRIIEELLDLKNLIVTKIVDAYSTIKLERSTKARGLTISICMSVRPIHNGRLS